MRIAGQPFRGVCEIAFGEKLVSVRRFKDLEAAPADDEIETSPQIDQSVRALQAPEWTSPATVGVDDAE